MTVPNNKQYNQHDLIILAQKMAKAVNQPAILALEGGLGAGKTTFARAWIQALSNAPHVPSPTFTLMQEYDDLRMKNRPLIHADFYRLQGLADLEEIGFLELIEQSIVLVEWASLIPALPDICSVPYARLNIKVVDDDLRSLCFKTHDILWKNLANSFGLDENHESHQETMLHDITLRAPIRGAL